MFFKLTYDLKDVLSVCILDVLRCSKCEASTGHGVGFGLGSKCGNPSTNTLKKQKQKLLERFAHLHIVLPGFSDVLSVRLPQGILS